MLRNRYGIVGIEIILEIACDDVFGQSGGSIGIGALDVVEGANGRQPDLGMPRRQFEPRLSTAPSAANRAVRIRPLEAYGSGLARR